MAHLMEFIFSNIKFVFFIGAIVFAIFTQVGKGAKKSSPKMPDFGELFPNVSTTVPTPPKKKAEQQPMQVLRKSQPLQDETRESMVNKALSEVSQATKEPVKSLQSEVVDYQQANHSRVVTSAELRQAVIWSEILGPPRAKRRHR